MIKTNYMVLLPGSMYLSFFVVVVVVVTTNFLCSNIGISSDVVSFYLSPNCNITVI